jgi:hypothetical protein
MPGVAWRVFPGDGGPDAAPNKYLSNRWRVSLAANRFARLRIDLGPLRCDVVPTMLDSRCYKPVSLRSNSKRRRSVS